MYAVIATGGKQERVDVGRRLQVERLGLAEGEEVSFAPVLVVDGPTVVVGADHLSAASVSARVVGEAKGPKITGFTYKPKSNNRRRWGHRQHYTLIEITDISTGESGASTEATSTEATSSEATSSETPSSETPSTEL